MLYHTTNILNFIQNVIDQYTKFFTSRVQGIPVLLIIILIYPQICFELGFQDGTGFFLIHLFPIKCTCFWQFSTLWLCNKVYNSTNPAYKKKRKKKKEFCATIKHYVYPSFNEYLDVSEVKPEIRGNKNNYERFICSLFLTGWLIYFWNV